MPFTEEQLQEMFGEDPETLAEMRKVNESIKATDKIVEMERRDRDDYLFAVEHMRQEDLLEEGAGIDKDLKALEQERERAAKPAEGRKAGSVLPFQKRK